MTFFSVFISLRIGEIFFLRSGEVIKYDAPASNILSLTGSGPNAENKGAITPPAFNIPIAAKYSSGNLSIKMKTLSPFCIPKSSITCPNLSDSFLKSV